VAIKPQNTGRSDTTAGAAKPPMARSEVLQAIGGLPPLSAVAIQLQNFGDEDADIRKVSNTISADPGLSADVLRMANSALFGARHTVPGVLHAIVMLGLDRVKSLVFTAAFMRFADPNRSSEAMKRCWRHSVACALIADEMAGRMHTDRDVAYTAGILHDIGRLAMLRVWPDPYGQILDRGQSGEDLLTKESAQFSVPHTEAGGYLMRRWKLPEVLIAAAEHHHDTEAPSVREPEGLIHCACSLADAIGFPALGEPSAAAREVSPAVKTLIGGTLEDMQFRVATRMNALEVWL
jgi:putative nucleotidyltransferase with HDIG domain